MYKRYKALFYDGKRPEHKHVNLKIFGNNLRLEFDDGTFKIWKISELEVQNNFQKNILRLEFGVFPPETLIINDSEFIYNFKKKSPKKNKILLFLIVLTLVILTPTFIYWGIPSISGTLSNFVPKVVEKKIGKYIINELFPNRKICQKPDGKIAAEQLMQSLSSPSFEYDFKLEIIDLDIINAIALPGGEILIFRGLLEKIMTAEAFAGVIAHEMQHILQKHGTENFINQIAISGFFKLLTIGENDLSATFFESIKILSILKYSREYEIEADELALKMLIQKKIDAKKMLSLFFILKEQSQALPNFISTHPDLDIRIDNLKKIIDSSPKYLAKPIISENNWISIKSICNSD